MVPFAGLVISLLKETRLDLVPKVEGVAPAWPEIKRQWWMPYISWVDRYTHISRMRVSMCRVAYTWGAFVCTHPYMEVLVHPYTDLCSQNRPKNSVLKRKNRVVKRQKSVQTSQNVKTAICACGNSKYNCENNTKPIYRSVYGCANMDGYINRSHVRVRSVCSMCTCQRVVSIHSW